MNNGEDWTKHTYGEAEAAIGYTFRDKELLRTCFTLKTYANNCGGESNERLEWLGDAVLDFIASDVLYHSETKAAEGELTNLRKQYVSKDALTPVAEKLELLRFARHSGGEGNLGGKTPSSLLEAVVAGIYLDGGIQAVRKFLSDKLSFSRLPDYKTLLQEYVQDRSKTRPEYLDREQDGHYVCTVSALGRSASGMGIGKKAAQTAAAKALYEQLMTHCSKTR